MSIMETPKYSEAEDKLLKEAIAIEFGISKVGELTYTNSHVEVGQDFKVKITHRAAKELIDTYGKIIELERQKNRNLLLARIQLGAYELTGGSDGLYKMPEDALEEVQLNLTRGRSVPQLVRSYLRPVTVKDLESMTEEELRHVYREINHMPKGSIAIIPENFTLENQRTKVALQPYDIDAVPIDLVEPLRPELDEVAALLRDHVPLNGALFEPEIEDVLETDELRKLGLEDENGDLFKPKE